MNRISQHYCVTVWWSCEVNIWITHVVLPFGGRAGGHAQGLLQVELPACDAVSWLRHADAAVTEELEAARGALLLHTNISNRHMSFNTEHHSHPSVEFSPVWWVCWAESRSPLNQWPWGSASFDDRDPICPARGPCWRAEWRVDGWPLEPPYSEMNTHKNHSNNMNKIRLFN